MNPIEAQLFGNGNASVADQLFSPPAAADVSSQLFGANTPSVADQLFDDDNGVDEDDDDDGIESDDTDEDFPEEDSTDEEGSVADQLFSEATSDVSDQLFGGVPPVVALNANPSVPVAEQLFGNKQYAEAELLAIPGIDLTRLLSPYPMSNANLTVNIGVVNIFHEG